MFADANSCHVQNGMVGRPARGPFRKVATNAANSLRWPRYTLLTGICSPWSACQRATSLACAMRVEPFTALVWHPPRSPLTPLSLPQHPVAGAQLQYNTTLHVASAAAVRAATVRILGASQNAAFSLRALEHIEPKPYSVLQLCEHKCYGCPLPCDLGTL
jgi:hypothetical protein